jgi:hypothetical protein
MNPSRCGRAEETASGRTAAEPSSPLPRASASPHDDDPAGLPLMMGQMAALLKVGLVVVIADAI